ncbi:MAG TPA: Smr/MutS family protein [Candidatus Baltobacteraceae bacterium]
MLADRQTLEALDFAGVLDRVVGATQTQRGRALAIVLEPEIEFVAVARAQAQTAHARELVVGDDFHVGRAIDTAPLTESAAIGRTLPALDLRAVAQALAAAAAAYKGTRARPSDVLGVVTAPYASLNDLVRSLTDAIDERGTVTDRASPALGRIRRGLSAAQADARDRVGTLARSGHRAIQDAVVTIRDGRFVVPVKAEFAGEFPGIVHDTSASGQTHFVEPLAALEANNRLRTLRLEEEREVARVLEQLSRAVGARASQIDANVEVLARLDLLCAKAAVARAMDAIAPELSERPEIEVVNGRHPLLGARAIPQSLGLGEIARIVVISGPNMGGKTVALKLVGLFVMMTYCGLQIPAAQGTIVGWFARVVADIGDEQSIAENASTFSAHLARMRDILADAGRQTLVLVDEVGGGTEPGAGAALAVAFLERLLAVGATAIVTTHATELKLFAHGTPGVTNASVRFDSTTFAPTYHLDIGAPGQSLAFPLARAMGIQNELLDRAQSLLDSQEREYESALAELAQRSAELQAERDAVGMQLRRLAERDVQLNAQREALDRERRSFTERAEVRMAQALREFVAELQRRAAENAARPKVTASQSALLGRTLDSMRRDLGIVAKPVQVVDDAALLRGDRVRVLSLDQEGTLAEDFGETLLVALGSLKTVVPRDDVRRLGPPARPARAQGHGGAAKLQAAARTMAELDVRGKRYIEAEPIVDRWIDEAVLAGNSPLRLIHGKGTGMLGSGLQEFLRGHPSVASVRYGDSQEGEGGVTIVELRS